MGLVRIVAPTDPVITLADAKAWLKVEHSDEDTLIQSLIDAFTAWLDGWNGVTGMALAEQEWRLTYDAFPCGPIKLPLGPLISVDAVKYRDAEGIEQTIDTADYQVDNTTTEGWVVPVTDWPSTGDTINAVTIEFTAGHAASGRAAACPDAIKLVLRLLVANAYQNREASTPQSMAALPFGVDALLAPYRRPMVTA